MQLHRYKLLKSRFDYAAGTIAYEYRGHDYGCARDDEYATGQPHLVLTADAEGGTPFFTIPEADVEQLL